MNYLNTRTPFVLFEKILNTDIYVDKSLLIEAISKNINTGKRYICITRPRRFGKTINANMLGAYYTKGLDARSLFAGLQIAAADCCKKHLNTHNVIYIDFSRMPDFCQSYQEYIANIIGLLREDLQEAYPHLREKKYAALNKMLEDSGASFIFIMDEWDSVFYEKFMRTEDKEHYLKFLKSLLKDQPYVELAYMTGVLPIVKYSSGSELNMFREHNFMNDRVYEEYFGFHEEEVRQLCEKCGTVSYEQLKRWYDGYQMSDGRHLFNPRSVSYALSDGVCLNYWTETGPMNEVADCIECNIDAVRADIVKMVSGITVFAELSGYSAAQSLSTRNEILSAMVVYGFLSYHDGSLKIPNQELMEKFQQVLRRDSMGAVKEVVEQSNEMLDATLHEDGQRVAQILEEVHDREIPFLKYSDENSLSCVITLCYLSARNHYWIEREFASGKGFCDYIFIPKKAGMPAMILELKKGHSAAEAVLQIKERGYIKKVEKYADVLFVGISYDEKKHHECVIERIKGKRD